MGQSPDLCWQVLQDEDEWWEERDEALAGGGPVEEPRQVIRQVAYRRLLSLAVAGALLLAQLLWLVAGQEQSAPGSAAAAPLAPRAVWESDYFVFAYAAQEREAAATAGRLLDARYGAVRRGLGLSAAGAEYKVPLAVDGPGLTDVEAFVCAGLTGPAEEAVAQALPPSGAAGSWRMTPGFVAGLGGWAQGVVCPEADGQEERFARRFGGRIPRLAALRPALFDFPYRGAGPGQSEREGAAFALLLAYAQARYGPGRLPLLLAAVQEPAVWIETIPAVYGVGVDEFEAGWRAWLAEEYGL